MTLKPIGQVPGPQGVAAQWDVFRRRYVYGDVLQEISARYGDVAMLPLPGCPTVLLSHPDAIQAVLTSKAQYFRIFGQTNLRRITPWGLVATEGQVHDDNRSRMMLAMRKILSRRLPTVAAQACRKHLEGVRDHDAVDVSHLAQEVTLRVAASILYPPDDDDPADHLDHAAFASLLSRSSAWLLRFPPAIQGAAFLIDLRRTIHVVRLRRKMQRQVRARMERLLARRHSGPHADLLTLLVDGSETGGPMPEEFLADNILNMLLAGYETSGNALAWALWETARSPALQEKIAAEGAALPADPGSHAEWMNDARWTDATLRETLRLYPSVWILCRQAIADYRVGDFLFPGGTVFVTSQWVTQRDPRWFEDPLQFEPARWEQDRLRLAAAASGGDPPAKRPLFSYFPFGAGNRFCIGKAAFEFEGSMMLASFFRDWIAEPVPDCRPQPKFFATMRADGPMWVRVRRR